MYMITFSGVIMYMITFSELVHSFPPTGSFWGECIMSASNRAMILVRRGRRYPLDYLEPFLIVCAPLQLSFGLYLRVNMPRGPQF